MTAERSTDVTIDEPRRRVLFIQTSGDPVLGADAAVLLAIIEHLDRRTHDVHVACRRTSGGEVTPFWKEASRLDEVSVVHCDLGPELSMRSGADKLRAAARTGLAVVSLARLAVRIRRRGIRIVHAGDRPRDALAAVLLGRLTGAVSVVHVHQVHSEWWTRLLRWTVQRADVLVPVSEFVGASLVAAGIEPERVRPVLNAVDVDRWVPTGRGPRVRAELGVAPDAPVVLTACRLFPAKGVAELLRAFAGVRARVPGAQLLVAGRDVSPEAEYAAELERLADELGVADAVHFLGHRSDVPDLMDAADVFALPSLGEPFGLVYVEAMSMGVPTVALAHGGALEIIDHGVTGLLAEPGDVQGLEDHLVALLESPESRAEMGRRGRASVEARFSTERQAQDVARLYASLDRGRPSVGS